MDYESEAARLRLIDISAPSKGAQLPAELLEVVLQHISQIRPQLFWRVEIRSPQKFLAFAALVRSSDAAVPWSLRLVVNFIELTVESSSRPWIYHIWALLRDVALPNFEGIELNIKGVYHGKEVEVGRRKHDGWRLDIGFPRTLPSAHPLHLRSLSARSLTFRSHQTLLRCLTCYDTEKIGCFNVQWPGRSAVSAPAGGPLSRLSAYPPNTINGLRCTPILPLIWRLVTTQLSAPGAARHPLYISTLQIDAVMGILHLCDGKAKEGYYNLQVYTGVCCLISDPMRSSFPDPTDCAMKRLRCEADNHILMMQVKSSGTVSRICLTMNNPYTFLSSSNILPSDQSTAAPVALDSMLTRFDRQCESLGDTLCKVVIAYLPLNSDYEIPQGQLAETMRKFRDQMPIMAGRHRLGFRRSRRTRLELSSANLEDTTYEHAFEQGGQYWTNISLYFQPPPASTAS
ncbi:hypothetical protein PHLGIDRAFT_119265 [Phlebiopsis gigantea 11061_1 CR5-6]|uniref:Uncharacterized protein n=1 Tax=Phlebiopsis gigantea (strain 11061_1 CR5-6) TaxID=745531 RepID=A0A0C3S6A1_PHLG1|nr:hypothetical protein PHLGIDRAFT_119265 [Phlebiopsis gigantea 11061_1 CR5-6]